jgi:hypothetical protein
MCLLRLRSKRRCRCAPAKSHTTHGASQPSRDPLREAARQPRRLIEPEDRNVRLNGVCWGGQWPETSRAHATASPTRRAAPTVAGRGSARRLSKESRPPAGFRRGPSRHDAVETCSTAVHSAAAATRHRPWRPMLVPRRPGRTHSSISASQFRPP